MVCFDENVESIIKEPNIFSNCYHININYKSVNETYLNIIMIKSIILNV